MNKEIYLVPYAHLDTQWRWEYSTSINKYLKNTIDENIYLFEKYPEHAFNFTGAIRYQMMKDYYPEKFEIVKKYIQEGRWHLAGTCLDETDALIPSVESSIRNILYGYKWQMNNFGKSSRDYMIPDCFGFPANLPSVMAHCNINGFSSNKLTWGSAVGIPFEIGRWQGPDKKEVVSVFNPCKYDSHLVLPVQFNLSRLKHLNDFGKKNGIWKSFQYYGVGDIGGAPKEQSVKNAISSMNHYIKKNTDFIVKQGAADDFFKQITEEEIGKMDLYEGDLLLTNHSAGTLTSAAIMKRWNRKNEQLAFATEAASVMAEVITGKPYPSIEINKAWQRIIGSQMHDILPGTSTPTAYEYAQNDEVLALNTFTYLLEDAAMSIASFVEGDGEILLFNPLEYERNDLVTINYPFASEKNIHKLVDNDGHLYDLQRDNQTISFQPHLQAFQWKKYKFVTDVNNLSFEKPVDLSLKANHLGITIENQFVKVIIDIDGRIETIIDKLTGKNILNGPLAYEFQNEKPMKFPSWNMDWKDRKKPPFKVLSKGAVEILDDGPLKKTVSITIYSGNSKFIKEISLVNDSRFVEMTERIDWRESGCSLKLAIATASTNKKVTYNWETCRIDRDINHEKQFEVPSRLWVNLNDFSLLEDSKYGYDRPAEDKLRMTLLYTPGIRYYNGFWDQKSQDWGEHTIRYAFLCHGGEVPEVDIAARRFNQPVRAFLTAKHNTEGAKNSVPFLSLDNQKIGLLALKKAESEEGYILRFYEKLGSHQFGKIQFATEIQDAFEVNGLEERISDAKYDASCLQVSVDKNSIKSYLVKFSKNDYVKPIQWPISLPFNEDIISENIETKGITFPRELIPEKIDVSGIEHHVEKYEKLNAMRAEGQHLLISKEMKWISVLATAEHPVDLYFEFIDEHGNIIDQSKQFVGAMTGYIGNWDTRMWESKPKHQEKLKREYAWINRCIGVKPGYVTRERVAWYSTHLHNEGNDLAYEYGYLYNIKLEVPEVSKEMVVPRNGNVKILAMTGTNDDLFCKSIMHFNDKYDF